MAFLTEAANRGSISTGYDIDNSCKFEADNSEYLERDPSSAGDRQKFTISMWVKRTEIGQASSIFSVYPASGPDNNNTLQFGFMSDDRFQLGLQTYYSLQSTRVFRDTSAWYHIVLAVDTTQSTSTNRFKVYVNGVLERNWDTEAQPAQNHTTGVNNTEPHRIGTLISNSWYFSGYMAEINHIDGSQLAPTEFGEFDADSGIWKPKAYTGSYGTNGFYLDFVDGADLGDDESGNGNDFTEVNITSADQATDTPTNNFCIFNPLMADNNAPTISEGGTKATGGGGTWNRAFGTLGAKNGKWYYEFKVTNTSYSGFFGASTTPAENSETLDAQFMYNTSFIVGNPSRIDYYYWQNGSQVSNESTGWGTISANDIIGVALDLDASTKKFYIYKNGSLVNSGGTDLPTNMQDEFVFPLYVQYENRQDEANFGGYTTSSISSAASDANGYGTFEHAPPSGYYAICTKNLAEYG